ncbi:MAG: AAA family ATPase, partial [Desulfobacteraceae bacterium]
PIRIYTLGRFRIVIEDRNIEFANKAPHKILSFLKGLIVFGRDGAGKEQMADLLWPDTEGDKAYKSFEISLHRLRKLLVLEDALLMENGRVRLNPRLCWVDAWAFEFLSDRTEAVRKPNDIRESRVLAEKALKLYNGEFLAGENGTPWTVAPAERLRNLFFKNIIRLGRDLEESGEWAKAAECYERGLQYDENREEISRRLALCRREIGKREKTALLHIRRKNNR